MANHLITGMPGAGKTLHALWLIEKRRVADNAHFAKLFKDTGDEKYNFERDVYYHNIAIKNLPWIKLEDPTKWAELPKGSIIVFDECQEAFPPRGTASKVPDFVAMTAKHRHLGMDLYFITQNPKNYDHFVRAVTEHHHHVSRPFGAQTSVVSTYKPVNDNVLKLSKGYITRKKFPFPKEVFGWYKSAEIHTHKFNMPFKFWLLLLFPFLLVLAGYYTYNFYAKKINPVAPGANQQTALQHPGMVSSGNIKAVFDPASFKPRIADVPWSAPRYDALTQATIAPVIMGCMVFQGICKCLTQQGTTHHATMQFCLAVIENGIFQDFDAGGTGSHGSDSGHIAKTSVNPPQNDPVQHQITVAAAAPSKPSEVAPARVPEAPYVPWTSRFHDTPSLSTIKTN